METLEIYFHMIQIYFVEVKDHVHDNVTNRGLCQCSFDGRVIFGSLSQGHRKLWQLMIQVILHNLKILKNIDSMSEHI